MYAKFLGAALAAGLRYPFDAVHAGRVLPEGLIAWLVARFLRRPLLIYCHGEELTTWRQPAKMRTMIWTFQHATLVIANSEYTRDELVKLGITREKIIVLYPGVDVARFCPGLRHEDLHAHIGLELGGRLIVSVGRLSRRKGFDQVIRALPLLLKRGLSVDYVVIGIGEDRDYLQALAREMGVSERVHLIGPVTPEDLPRWYCAADVVTMPNREIDGDTEGFGMVLLEAAACARPTVAGVAGGTGAAVIDGATGLLVDGASTPAVAEAIGRLLENPELSKDLGERGYRRAVSEFSWQQVADKTRQLHAGLLAR